MQPNLVGAVGEQLGDAPSPLDAAAGPRPSNRERDPGQPDHVTAIFLVGLTALLVLLFGLLVLTIARNGITERGEGLIYLTFFAASPVLAALAAVCTSQIVAMCHTVRLPRWTLMLAALPPLGVVVWGLQGIEVTLYHLEYRQPDLAPERFVPGAVGAVVLVSIAGLLVSRRPELGRVGSWARRVGFIVGTVGLLALFDITISPDTLSYGPYLGSAAAVVLGATPLVEVFSQYGFNFLLFSAALTVLPWSFFSASLVVAGLNAVYWTAWGWICAGASRSRLMGLLLGALGILFLHAAAPFNVTYTPSVAAMRFLPSTLLLLALAWMPAGRRYSVPAVLALMLGAVWSLEALLFTLLPYLVYVGAQLLAHQRSLSAMVRDGFRAGVILSVSVVVPHVLLDLVILAAYGTLPRYDVYLELIGAQSTDQAGWEILISPRIQTWVLFGYGYAVALCLGLFHSWTAGRQPADRDDGAVHRATVLAAIAAFGILQFSYYVGRSTTPALFYVAFPLLAILVVLTDYALVSLRNGVRPTLALVAAIACILAFAGIGGVFADRFGRPFDPSLAPRSHTSILRACFVPSGWTACSPAELHDYYWTRLHAPPGYPQDESGGSTTREESQAAYQLLERWQPDETRLLPFITDAATVLFHLHKTHRLGLAHPMVDGLSPTLASRALDEARALPVGTVLVVGQTDRSAIDRAILDMLRERWQFCVIETVNNVTAFELREPAEGDCQLARHP